MFKKVLKLTIPKHNVEKMPPTGFAFKVYFTLKPCILWRTDKFRFVI